MRFIHTADWHLGRTLNGISLIPDQAHALDQFIRTVESERPDFLIIAGDIYDRAIPPVEAIDLLDRTLTTIGLELRVPCVIISGNHDSADRLNFGHQIFGRMGVHLRTRLADYLDPVTLPGIDIPIHALPYCEPAEVRALAGCDDLHGHDAALGYLLDKIAGQVGDDPAIVIAHAFVAGGRESESERIIAIGGTGQVDAARFAPFTYTALGHLHAPQSIGKAVVRYAGSPCRYSFSEEKHDKSFAVVDLDGNEPVIRAVPIEQKRGMRTIEGEFDAILEEAKKNGSDDFLRIHLLDKVPVLDPRDRLAQYYPNIVEITRTQLIATASGQIHPDDFARLNPDERFHSFFKYILDRDPSPEQEQIIKDVVAELQTAEENGTA